MTQEQKIRKREYARRWFANHPEYKPKDRKVYVQEYRSQHKDEDKEYRRQWRETHPEYMKQYRRMNKNKVLQYHVKSKGTPKYVANGKAKEANKKYPGHITASEVLLILQNNILCYWCKKELPFEKRTLEHLRPINEIQYLTVACHSCNSAKFAIREVA